MPEALSSFFCGFREASSVGFAPLPVLELATEGLPGITELNCVKGICSWPISEAVFCVDVLQVV